MKDASPACSRKQARIIQRALTQLAKAKSYKPIMSIEDFGEAPFGRELQLTNHRMVLLTDHGMEQVERIVNTTVEADPYAGLADYADVWSASWKTLEELVSNGRMAEDAHYEKVALMKSLLAKSTLPPSYGRPNGSLDLFIISSPPWVASAAPTARVKFWGGLAVARLASCDPRLHD